MEQKMQGRLIAALCLGSLLVLGGCATEPGLDTAPAMAKRLVHENADAQQLRPFLEGQGYVMQLEASQDVVNGEQSLLGIPFARGNEQAHLVFQRGPRGEVSLVVALVLTTGEADPASSFRPFGVVNGRVEPLRVPSMEPAPYCDLICQAGGTYACMVKPGWWEYGYPAANDCLLRSAQLCGC